MVLDPVYHGEGRDKLPLIGCSINQLTTNYTINVGTDIPIYGRELFIANDGASTITITVNCNGGQLIYQILGGEQFDERLPSFSSVIVSGGLLWRWKVRGNLT